jgi:transcriptional regulator with XRE-family HTH domain
MRAIPCWRFSRVCSHAERFVETLFVSDKQLPPLQEASTFSSELIKARAELGLTQSQLAERSGLSLSAVKAYEAGRNMPGARELRELCQALQVSPNKLLFGKELPFEEKSIANLLIEGTPEDVQVTSTRTALLLSLLASDERASVATLVRSLAIARQGVAKVDEAVIAADLMSAMGRELTRQTGVAMKTGEDVNPTEFVENMEGFMDRQGHIPDSKKLPKK